MKNNVKATMIGIAVLALGMIARTAPVYAVGLGTTCPSGSITASTFTSCTFDFSNTTQLDGEFTVTVSYNAGTHTLTLSAVDNFPGDNINFVGFDVFGANITGATFVTGNPTGWTAEPPDTASGCNHLDGFGDFADCTSQGGGGTTANPSFVLSGAATSFDVNSGPGNPGTHFAVHIKTNINGCTGFFGDVAVGLSDNSSCPGTVPPTSIPDPSALLLFGSGLIAVSAFARSRIRRR